MKLSLFLAVCISVFVLVSARPKEKLGADQKDGDISGGSHPVAEVEERPKPQQTLPGSPDKDDNVTGTDDTEEEDDTAEDDTDEDADNSNESNDEEEDDEDASDSNPDSDQTQDDADDVDDSDNDRSEESGEKGDLPPKTGS